MTIAAEPRPSWTPERHDALMRMVAAGMSASKIAAALGGVTRNAVLGRMHRAGLAGPAAITWTDEREATLRDLWGKGVHRKDIARKLGLSLQAVGTKVHRLGLTRKRAQVSPSERSLEWRAGRGALAQRKAPPSTPQPRPCAEVIPLGQRCSLMDLTPDTCRWPIGDVGEPGFAFCGGQTLTDLPYCAYHSRLAYQPAVERRREVRSARV